MIGGVSRPYSGRWAEDKIYKLLDSENEELIQGSNKTLSSTHRNTWLSYSSQREPETYKQ